MISDQDITKLKEVFATKEEFADLKLEVGEMKDKLDGVDDKLDFVVGTIKDLLIENSAEAHIFSRHARQLEALAIHAGVTLPD